jgi:hypothetical protein
VATENKIKTTVFTDQAKTQPAVQIQEAQKPTHDPQANIVIWRCQTRNCKFPEARKHYRPSELIYYPTAKCPMCKNTIEPFIKWFNG